MTQNQACEKILIIEDDEPIRITLQELLEGEGYTVLTAENGQEALTLLKSNDQRPCLILLDMFMPVMDGWQFLNHIKSQESRILASIPVVITSAAGDRVKEAAQRAEGFIKKPFELESLLLLVARYCSKKSN